MRRLKREREQFIAALAWLRANLREGPPPVYNTGTIAGWSPVESEPWEQNLAAVDALLTQHVSESVALEPRAMMPGMFVEVVSVDAETSVSSASSGPLHARVGAAGEAPRCLRDCPACAAGLADPITAAVTAGAVGAALDAGRVGAHLVAQALGSIGALVTAAPAGTPERAAQLARAGIPVDTSITATASGAPGAAGAVCTNCLGAGHTIDDCIWTREATR